MTETLSALDQRNYRNCQSCFRGNPNQEYHLGDFSIEVGSGIEVRADKKAAGGCSIIRVRSNARLFLRRPWSHIREDSTEVTVLWPFFIECHVGNDAMHEVLQRADARRVSLQ